MNLSIIHTRAQVGINAPLVTVETHISNGLPSLAIVGLPETAVRESRERVRSALLNSGFEFPTRRVTINLAPADLPKQGGRYDLAIAISILVASGQLEANLTQGYEFLGELALTGALRSVPGVLPSSLASANANKQLFVASGDALEASMAADSHALGSEHLLSVCNHLQKREIIEPTPRSNEFIESNYHHNLSDVKGQHLARSALEISAAGRHNLLLFGPPGTGKSLLASRLPGILPSLSEKERIEVACIYSLANQSRSPETFGLAPFRSPHHTASGPALVGGGTAPSPGEISLAHKGVLFLDELPEFNRKVLEVLREPIEKGEISISRANASITFPADFQLIAAMNPCPCGYSGHPKIACSDTPQQVEQYKKKLSGPLLDRFDLHVEVTYQPPASLLTFDSSAESSETVLERVSHARSIQMTRQSKLNSELEGQELMASCRLSKKLHTYLEQSLDKLALSARSVHRVLKVSRTIADLQEQQDVSKDNLLQALSFRALDKRSH